MTNGIAATQFDLTDLSHYADAVPHSLFDAVRSTSPVYWNVGADDVGAWHLTAHAEVALVQRDNTNFTTTRGVTYPPWSENELLTAADLALLMDPPRHTRIRRIHSRSFTPRVVAQFETWIRDVVNEVLDDVTEKGSVNFCTAVAGELSAGVVGKLIGVPHEDRHLMYTWANKLFFREDATDDTAFHQSLVEVITYVNQLRRVKASTPGDDLMTALLEQQNGDDAGLTDGEFAAFFFSLLGAGYETTHSLLSTSMRLMLQDQEASRLMHADPSELRNVVEELLRFVSPFTHSLRCAKNDVAVGDRTIKAGEFVVLWLAAANRDPAVFVDPHRFDPGRQNLSRHVAFGGGQHSCLGAHLARLEARIFLEELFTRDLEMQLVGEPVRHPGLLVNSLKSLPITVTTGHR